MTRARTGRRADTLSSEAFAPEPTSSRLLDALSSHVRLFVAITLTFSVLGGLLQVVGSARGPLARTLGTAVTVHVAGNLVASAVAITLVVAARQRARRRPAPRRPAPRRPAPRRPAQRHRTARRWGVSVPAATLGGALGGAARLPLELLVGSDITTREAAASVLTDAGWFLIAALATNTVARLARNERETRDALSEALQHQTVMRTQMLEADLQTRRDVAEWLHGRLQAELLLAADAVRRTGPAGEAAAERLARLRDEELRGLTRSLHPTLAEIDLTGALHELARRFADVTDVRVDVDEELVRSPLPRAVSVALYRACEEAVGNAVKHGSARQVAVRVRRDGSAAQVVLTVADDGAGHAAGTPGAGTPDEGPGASTGASTGTGIAPGLGLAIIDTYVRTVGGTWDLGVTDGAGATLSVTVPLPDVSG